MTQPSNHKFAPVRSVTLPVLKLKPGADWRYVVFLAAMFVGKKLDDQKEAATLARVVDMETGEEGQIIMSTVLKKEMAEQYPGEAYVGRGFGIKLTRDPEKKYNVPSIVEVSIPDEMQAAVDRLSKVSGAITKAEGGKSLRRA